MLGLFWSSRAGPFPTRESYVAGRPRSSPERICVVLPAAIRLSIPLGLLTLAVLAAPGMLAAEEPTGDLMPTPLTREAKASLQRLKHR